MERNRKIISAVCLVICLGCVAYLCNYYYKQHQANEVYDDLKISADADESADATGDSSEIDFEAYWKINEDVIAYIDVPGTDVSYPVLQSEDDDTYYLEHTIEGVEGLPGSIYTETWQNSDFTDPVTIIYGHNMKNGTMFASLHDFEDQDFFDQNKSITIYTPDRTYDYNIYCAIVYDNSYIPTAYDLSDQSAVDEFISSLDTGDSRNHFNSDVQIQDGDKLLVLSTCIGNSDYRYLVVGVLDGETTE